MKKRILVATDFSEASRKAVDFSRFLFHEELADITLVHVFESDTLYMPAPYNLSNDEAWFGERIAEMKGKAKAALEQEKKTIGNNVKTVLLEGKPKKSLVSFIGENDFDMVILGTHGYSGIERWVLGSVAEYVVRHSTSAVLTVPQER